MRVPTLLALVVALLAAPLGAEKVRQVGWSDLKPPIGSYDDPFRAMGHREMYAVLDLVEYAETEAGSRSPELVSRHARARELLEGAGYDVGYLVAQYHVVRETVAREISELNPEVVDARVRMAGYLLPLEMRGRRAVEFLLVPYLGACVHTAAPSQNQVVYVVYADGSDPMKMHNYYTNLYNQCVFEVLEEKLGKGEATLFARSAGQHRVDAKVRLRLPRGIRADRTAAEVERLTVDRPLEVPVQLSRSSRASRRAKSLLVMPPTAETTTTG